MRHIILHIIILLFSLSLSAQKSIVINGNVYDRLTTQHLPHVHLSVLKPDSSVVAETEAFSIDHQNNGGSYTRIEKGTFVFRLKATNDPYIIRFTKDGYDTLYQPLDLSKLGTREYEVKLPPVYMTPIQENPTVELDELVVKTSKIKFYHKGDTIVYNADAFLLPQGSSLDALISKLPGVQIREGGKIYVNGKYVESLLLNGKDFFKGNQDVLRQNLGAYAVKDIAVYDIYGDMSRLMETQLEEDKEYVMDVRLKKDYMGGFIGNAEASYGTEDRYSGRLFGMHFNNYGRFSIYGNINNTNNTNRPSDGSGFSFNRNSTSGISDIANGGFDYNVEDPRKEWTVGGNIDVNHTANSLNSTVLDESFLQQNSFQTTHSEKHEKSISISTNHQLKLNKERYFLTFKPEFRYNRSRATASNAAVEFNSNIQERYDINRNIIDAIYTGTYKELREALINRNRFDRHNRSNSYRGYFWSEQGFRFKGSPDAFYIYIEGEYDRDRSDSKTAQTIDYGFNGIDAPIASTALRRDNSRYPAYTGWIKGAARYYVKSHKGEFSFGYEFRHEQQRKTSLEFLYESNVLDEEAVNPVEPSVVPDLGNTNSSKLRSNVHMIKSSLLFMTNLNQNVSLRISLRPEFHINRRNMLYNAYAKEENGFFPTAIPINRTSCSFNSSHVSATLSTADDKHYLDISYRFDTKYAPLTDMIDIPNTVDPLNILHGNPELKDAFNQNLRIQYSANPMKNSTLCLTSYFDYNSRDIVKGYTFDSKTGVRDFHTLNVSGNLTNRNNIDFIKSYGFGNHELSYDIYAAYSFYRYANMIGEDSPMRKQVVFTNGISYGIQVEYSFMSKYSVGGSFNGINNFSRADSRDRTRSVERRLIPRAWLNIKLPFNLSINCDVQYMSIRGTDSKGIDPDQCLLNANIRYQLNANWSLRIEGYDLLGQQKPYSNVVTADGRTQTIVNALPRYCMLTVGYRFSTKKK